jgi:hypothetical protein
VTAFFAPGGFAMRAAEESRHGLGEVPQRLLLHHLAAGGQPFERGASLSQLTTLSHISRTVAASRPPPGLLLDCQVPYISGVSAVLPQVSFLRQCRYKPVTGHESNLITTADILKEVKRRLLSA